MSSSLIWSRIDGWKKVESRLDLFCQNFRFLTSRMEVFFKRDFRWEDIVADMTFDISNRWWTFRRYHWTIDNVLSYGDRPPRPATSTHRIEFFSVWFSFISTSFNLTLFLFLSRNFQAFNSSTIIFIEGKGFLFDTRENQKKNSQDSSPSFSCCFSFSWASIWIFSS